MTNVNGGSGGANEFAAATGQGPMAERRPEGAKTSSGANPKSSGASEPADMALANAARPERRYSFNMLVATALLAFAAGRICSR